MLSALTKDEAAGGQVEERQTAWQSVSRKEFVEMRDDRYRFAVELF